MNYKVSVIIPCHNEEKYISRMLYSVMMSTYNNWECVIICNACDDDSYEIAKTYQNIDDRFVVYNYERGGVSRARNTGIGLSSGELIMFFDADDYIESDYIENMVNVYDQTKENVIKSHMYVHDKNYCFDWGIPKSGRLNVDDGLLLSNDSYDIGFCPSFIFNRETIEGITFNEGLCMCEDLCFNMDVVLKNKGLYSTDCRGYHYCMYNSGTQGNNVNAEKIIEHYDNLSNLYGENVIFRDFLLKLISRKNGNKNTQNR